MSIEQEVEQLVEQARALLEGQTADVVSVIEQAQTALEQAKSLETRRRAAARSEHERAHELQGRLSTVVEQAKAALDQSVARFLLALEQIETVLNGARTAAHTWNAEHAHTLLLNDDYAIHVIVDGYVSLDQARAAVRGIRVVAGGTAPIPSIRVRLNPDLAFRDYPRGAEITLPAAEAQRIEQRPGPRMFKRV